VPAGGMEGLYSVKRARAGVGRVGAGVAVGSGGTVGSKGVAVGNGVAVGTGVAAGAAVGAGTAVGAVGAVGCGGTEDQGGWGSGTTRVNRAVTEVSVAGMINTVSSWVGLVNVPPGALVHPPKAYPAAGWAFRGINALGR
jgi:hypothetical protein